MHSALTPFTSDILKLKKDPGTLYFLLPLLSLLSLSLPHSIKREPSRGVNSSCRRCRLVSPEEYLLYALRDFRWNPGALFSEASGQHS